MPVRGLSKEFKRPCPLDRLQPLLVKILPSQTNKKSIARLMFERGRGEYARVVMPISPGTTCYSLAPILYNNANKLDYELKGDDTS